MSKLPFRAALVLALCLLLLGPTRASGSGSGGGGGEEVVSDCGDTGLPTQMRDKLLLAQERDSLLITFSCTGPVVLLDGVLPTIYLDVTIDGGGTMVLSGGSATRLARFYTRNDKTYQGTVRFGFATDTYDAEGSPTGPPAAVTITAAEIEPLLDRFRGPFRQVPPPVSAKKINGRPAYELARKNLPVELAPVELTPVELLPFGVRTAEERLLPLCLSWELLLIESAGPRRTLAELL